MAEGGRPRRQAFDNPVEDDATYIQEENIGNRTETHDISFDAVTAEQGTSSDLKDESGKTRDRDNKISGGSHRLTIQGGEFGRFVQKQVFHTFRGDLASGETRRPLEPGAFRISSHMSVLEQEPISFSSRVFRTIIHSNVTGDKNAVVKITPADEKHQQEANIHFSVPHHKNIVERIATDVFNFRGQPSIYIVMEQCDCSLDDHIKSQVRDEVPFDKKKYLSISRQTVVALSFLHSNNVIHGDLKPGNVLLILDKNAVKLCDFGLSRAVSGDKTSTDLTSPQGGTTGWLAPEVLKGTTKIGFKSDIFPSGLLVFHCLSYGRHPYGDKPVSWNHYIVNGENRNLEGMLIPDAESAKLLLELMMEQNPADRPTAEDVLKHPLFADEGTRRSNALMKYKVSSTQTDAESSEARSATQLCCMIEIDENLFVDTQNPIKKGYDVYNGVKRLKPSKKVIKLAVKMFHVDDSLEADWVKAYEKELENLLQVRWHRHVVHFESCGKMKSSGDIYIAMSRCHQTTLEDIKITNVESSQRTQIFLQICHGLNYIHSENLAHMDLKPGNILFSLDGRNAVISDFGISKNVNIQREGTKTTVSKSSGSSGTRGWMAKELLKNEGLPKDYFKADIFALGLVGMHVLFGYHPFADAVFTENRTKANRNIRNGNAASLAKLKEQKKINGFLAVDLFKTMLSHTIGDRPKVEDVLKHCYFWSSEKKTRQIKLIAEHLKRRNSKKDVWVDKLDISQVYDSPLDHEKYSHWMLKLEGTSIYEKRLMKKEEFKNTVMGLSRYVRNCCEHKIAPTSNIDYQKMWEIVANKFSNLLPYLINSLPREDREIFLEEIAYPQDIDVLTCLEEL